MNLHYRSPRQEAPLVSSADLAARLGEPVDQAELRDRAGVTITYGWSCGCFAVSTDSNEFVAVRSCDRHSVLP